MAVANVTYNIDVKSKFDLFSNDDFCEAEPDELVKKLKEDKKKKELALKEAKKQKQIETKKVVSKSTIKSQETKVEEKPAADKAQRNTKSATKPKENIEQIKKTQLNKTESLAAEDSSNSNSNDEKPKRVSAGGIRKTRGREFDRHSGSDKTGVKCVERRDGSGSYNWGNVKDVVNLPEDYIASPVKDVVSEETPINTESLEVTEKIPGKVEMTISEWKALHGADSVINSQMKVRSANNGENVFTGMNVYKKRAVQLGDSEVDIAVVDDDNEIDNKGRRQIRVNVEFSGRRGGGRGPFANSRYKNGGGQSKADEVIIKLDEEEFPTLS